MKNGDEYESTPFLVILGIAIGAILILISNCAGSKTSKEFIYHYKDYNGIFPKNNTVYVCHTHGCNKKEKFIFSKKEIEILKSIFSKAENPKQEREKIKIAISWIENTVGKKTGTHRDKKGASFFTSGVEGQMDCVDESMNTTNYLLILKMNKILRFHSVLKPIVRMAIIPHWAAHIKELNSNKTFVVDSYFGNNGKEPLILTPKQWGY